MARDAAGPGRVKQEHARVRLVKEKLRLEVGTVRLVKAELWLEPGRVRLVYEQLRLVLRRESW